MMRARSRRDPSIRRIAPVDLALGVAAAAFGSVTLTFPFGRDQALFYYVGREWFLRGAVPYRDVYENKTPFIHALHALLIALVGEGMWPIRAAEIVAVLALGALAGLLSTRPEEPPREGARGAAMFAASVFYFGYFPFQDTANCEIWCALFTAASLVVATRSVSDRAWVALVAGAFFGLAIVAKPPALCLAPLVAWALLGHLRRTGPLTPRRAALVVAVAVVGAALVPTAIAIYFFSHGALASLNDVVFGANRFFTAHGRLTGSASEIARETYRAFDWFIPFSYVCVIASVTTVARALHRGDAERARRDVWPLAAASCAYAAILWQGKFFIYHYALLALPFSVWAANVYADISTWLVAKRSRLSALFPSGYAIVLASLVVAMTPHDIWLFRVGNTALWMTGALSWDELTARFSSVYIDMADAARVGAWLRVNAAGEDTLLVRGYEPEIYAFAQRHSTARFFWTGALVDPNRAYRRAEWLAEDRAYVEARSSRWIVASEAPFPALDSARWFESLGYERREVFGPFTILERK
jgi:hypothetical protein